MLGYTYQALLMVVGVWLTPFLLGRVGQHDYGIWLIGLQVLAYLGLADIGVVALLPREVAYATGRAGGAATSAELPSIIGRTFRVVLYQTPLVGGIAALIWLLYPTPAQYRGFLGLILVTFTLLFPFRVCRAVLEGLQDLQFQGRVQIVSWLTGTGLTVALVLLGSGFYAMVIGWAFSQVLATAAFGYRLLSRFPQVLPRQRSHFLASGTGAYMKSGLWASLTQVAQPLLNGSDILFVGKMLGPAAVVPYTCTGKLAFILGNQPQMLLEAALPGLSEVRAGRSKADLLRVATALTQVSLMISGAVVCVIVAANRGFVNWWVGPNLFSGQLISCLMALRILLRHCNTTTVYTMFSLGMERRLSILTLADGVVTCVASFGLIAWLGPIGGPLASILSVCIVCLPGNIAAVAREAEVSTLVLLRPLWPWFWRFLVLLSVALAVAQVWTPSNIVQTGLTAALAGLIYVAAMLSIGPKSIIWPYLQPRVRPLWNLVTERLG